MTILEHIKASDLPAFLTKNLKIEPDATLRITIELESELEEEGMPPEEDFRPEVVAMVEQQTKDYKAGKLETDTCKTPEELDQFFKKTWG